MLINYQDKIYENYPWIITELLKLWSLIMMLGKRSKAEMNEWMNGEYGLINGLQLYESIYVEYAWCEVKM